jgi:hypothetical protein
MEYENYPFTIILISNLFQFCVYFIGAFIISQIGYFWLIPYFAYILFLEFKLLKTSCVNCYYYGKRCAFGKGKISSIFFKKGNELFCQRKITWKNILPDFLVSIIPFTIGIILLILNFNWLNLGLIILLVLLSSFGNGFIRSSLACKYCKQKELGCPAEKLFQKKQKD